MTLLDEIESWRPRMEGLLGKEKWDSLTYWQQMCEIAALKQDMKDNPICPMLGF